MVQIHRPACAPCVPQARDSCALVATCTSAWQSHAPMDHAIASCCFSSHILICNKAAAL